MILQLVFLHRQFAHIENQQARSNHVQIVHDIGQEVKVTAFSRYEIMTY